MDTERDEGQDETLEDDRELVEQGNTDAKMIMPKDDEPSDDPPDSPPDQRT